MTSSIAEQVANRAGAHRRPRTMGRSLAARFRARKLELQPESTDLRWPSAKYRDDPVGFAVGVLGIAPWDRQAEFLCAVRDNKRVAVASGHKVSKSCSLAIIALWFYCSYEDARVVMSSTTSRQVDQILWREIRMRRARALHPIDGDMHELARSGFKASDFREIVGFTAREAEAVAGVSGKNLLYAVDEASGVPDEIFEAIEGNRAGGARLVMTGNPTRTEGEFFEAFHAKKDFYKTLEISSEETPNVREGRDVIPGLATREWIDEKKLEWGEDSPLYKVRVKGKFVLKEDAKVISIHMIAEAEQRWHVTPDEGRLYLGIDPAGPGGAGDESVFAPRRGQKVLTLFAMRGLSEEAHLVHALGMLSRFKRPREQLPVIVMDREGSVGAKVWGFFRSHVEQHPNEFELVGVRSSDRAIREPNIYGSVRDELWGNCAQWLREGGGIPEDTRLSKELHAPEFKSDIRGRLKVTPKDELRKKLSRSPDRADAVCLAVWEIPDARAGQGQDQQGEPDPYDGPKDIDPYATIDGFGVHR